MKFLIRILITFILIYLSSQINNNDIDKINLFLKYSKDNNCTK
jgi:hypothetical protein